LDWTTNLLTGLFFAAAGNEPRAPVVFLWLALAPVVEAGSRDIGMTEPFLHSGDVRLVWERVRRRRTSERMHTQPYHFKVDARFAAVFPDDVAIDGARLSEELGVS
jgi:hypothetical protein